MPALEAAGVFSASASSPPAGFVAPVLVAAEAVSGCLSVAGAVGGALFSATCVLVIVLAVVDLIAVAGF